MILATAGDLLEKILVNLQSLGLPGWLFWPLAVIVVIVFLVLAFLVKTWWDRKTGPK